MQDPPSERSWAGAGGACSGRTRCRPGPECCQLCEGKNCAFRRKRPRVCSARLRLAPALFDRPPPDCRAHGRQANPHVQAQLRSSARAHTIALHSQPRALESERLSASRAGRGTATGASPREKEVPMSRAIEISSQPLPGGTASLRSGAAAGGAASRPPSEMPAASRAAARRACTETGFGTWDTAAPERARAGPDGVPAGASTDLDVADRVRARTSATASAHATRSRQPAATASPTTKGVVCAL